jgi:hypothetical protein
MVRLRRRRRWLHRVTAGQEPRWRVVENRQPTEILPAIVSGDALGRVLVRVHDASEPFRESEQLEPVAAFPSRP